MSLFSLISLAVVLVLILSVTLTDQQKQQSFNRLQPNTDVDVSLSDDLSSLFHQREHLEKVTNSKKGRQSFGHLKKKHSKRNGHRHLRRLHKRKKCHTTTTASPGIDFTVTPVGHHANQLGEGPHWDEKRQVLFYVDLAAFRVWKLDPVDGREEKRQFDGFTTIVIPYEHTDDLLISLNLTVGRFDWAKNKFHEIASVDGPDGSKRKRMMDNDEVSWGRFNDGKCDALGRLWIGTLYYDDDGEIVPECGSLYRLDGNRFIVMSTGYSIPNGIGWSNDNRKMYFNDSGQKKTFVFDFDLDSGTISNKKLLWDAANEPGYGDNWIQDGLAIDVEGKIWTAIHAGGRVVQINQNTGRLENTILIPAQFTTSVFFGGPNYDQMFVTSAKLPDRRRKRSISRQDNSRAGWTFKVTSTSSQFRAAGPGNRFNPN